MQKAEFSIPLMGASGIVSEAVLLPPCIGHVCLFSNVRTPDDCRALLPAEEKLRVRAGALRRRFYETTDTKMKRFEERTVVITGASRGIGKGIAKRFGDEGANLVLAANEPSVDAVAEEFRAVGRERDLAMCAT